MGLSRLQANLAVMAAARKVTLRENVQFLKFSREADSIEAWISDKTPQASRLVRVLWRVGWGEVEGGTGWGGGWDGGWGGVGWGGIVEPLGVTRVSPPCD